MKLQVLLALLIILISSSARGQSIGLSATVNNTESSLTITQFTEMRFYVHVDSPSPLAEATVALSIPGGLTILGSQFIGCSDCQLVFDTASSSLRISNPTCLAGGTSSVVEIRAISLGTVAEDAQSWCVDLTASSYVTCAGLSGQFTSEVEYGCPGSSPPRCLNVNWFLDCGLPSRSETWGMWKAAW